MLNGILEVAKRASKGGKVPIKIALLKIHQDESETNNNGVHWKQEYVTNASESAKMIPICAEFCDEAKTVPFGHGFTRSTTNSEGLDEPLFENSDVVGVIENTSIETVQVKNSEILALVGNGYLYNQRYPDLVKWVRNNYALGTVDTSIEIMGLAENDNKIVYEEARPTEDYRTPKEFVFSGTAILSVAPGDDNAVVLEVAEKKVKEENKVDEKELKTLIKDTIQEVSDKSETFSAKITELNSTIAEKDSKITELSAKVEELQKSIDSMTAEQESAKTEKAELEKQLGELKTTEKLNELNSMLASYTAEEQAYATAEINSFKEKPLEGSLDSIKAKICVGIVEKQKEDAKKTSEVNEKKAKTEVVADNIFGGVEDVGSASMGDVNIF